MKLIVAFSILFLAPLSGASAEPNKVCSDAFSYISTSARVNAILGRAVLRKEWEAIQHIREDVKSYYTITDIANQTKLLKKAGLSDAEIRNLRKTDLLTGSAVFMKGTPPPEKAQAIVRKLVPIDKNFLEQLKESKKTFRYIVDHENQIFMISGDELSSDTLWMVRGSNDPDAPMHIVKETGVVQRKDEKTISFHPLYSLDSTKIETDKALEKLGVEYQGSKLARLSTMANEQSTVLNCMDILAKQTTMRSSIFDRLLADNLVVTSAFAVTELAGANRFSTSDGRDVIVADMIGTNVNSVVSATLGSYLVQGNRSLPVSLATRTATAMGMIEVQRGIYKATLENDAQERADKIAFYDQMYFFARLPVAHYTDKFIMKQLPEMLYDSCRRGSKLSVVITPTTVRIMERYGMAVLYYGTRSAIVNE